MYTYCASEWSSVTTVQTVGDLLRSRRKELKHNQIDAGRALGVSGPTVSRWETGQDTPGNDQIDALANYLGKSVPVVLAAVHAQATSADSDERIFTMLAEVLAEVSELRQLIERRDS